jgi:hypothetical protein
VALTDSHEASWGFNNNGLDGTPNARHLTAVNTPTYATSPAYAAARCARAGSQYFERTTVTGFPSGDNPYTIRVAFKPHSLPAAVGGVIGQWSHLGTPWQWLLYITDAGVLRYSVSSGFPQLTDVAVANLVAGTWYHVLIDHVPAADVIGYRVNGGARSTSAHAGGITAGSHPLRVNVYGHTASFLADLSLDVGDYWSRAPLTEDEASELYNDGAWLEYPFVPHVRTVRRRAESFSSVRVRR